MNKIRLVTFLDVEVGMLFPMETCDRHLCCFQVLNLYQYLSCSLPYFPLQEFWQSWEHQPREYKESKEIQGIFHAPSRKSSFPTSSRLISCCIDSPQWSLQERVWIQLLCPSTEDILWQWRNNSAWKELCICNQKFKALALLFRFWTSNYSFVTCWVSRYLPIQWR